MAQSKMGTLTLISWLKMRRGKRKLPLDLTLNLLWQIDKELKEAGDALLKGEVSLIERTFHQFGLSQYAERERGGREKERKRERGELLKRKKKSCFYFKCQ